VDVSGRFLYVGGVRDCGHLLPGTWVLPGVILVYRIDPQTGALALLQQIDTGPVTPWSFALTPRFLYVASGGRFSAYRIDPAAGTLTPEPALSSVGPAERVATDPPGRFVYVVALVQHSFISAIHAYAVDAQTGELTVVPGSPFYGDLGFGRGVFAQNSLAVDPTGRLLFAVGLQEIWEYAINPGNGALEPLQRVAFRTREQPRIVLTPPGGFVYALSQVALSSDPDTDYESALWSFTVGPSGTLAPVPGYPTALPFDLRIGPAVPLPVVADPSGRFLYGISRTFDGIAGYAVNAAAGELVPIPGLPLPLSVSRGVSADLVVAPAPH